MFRDCSCKFISRGLLSPHACRISIGISAVLLFLGAAVFNLGRYFSGREPDYRIVTASEDASAAHDEDPGTPLLRDTDGASHV